MAIRSTGRFGFLRYEPGNPEFPTLPDGLLSGHPINVAKAAGLTFRGPQIEILEKKSVNDIGRYGEWFFDGVWRSPNPVDFGNITSAKQRVVDVHNSFRTSITITAIDVSAVSGVTVDSPALPLTIEAFATAQIVFEASSTGDPDFDAEAVFTVDGVLLPLRMIGRRVIIFDTIPQRDITERLSFLTDTMIAHSGIEQVMSLRVAPRSIVSLQIRQTDDVERNRLLNLLYGAQFLRFGVQLWWQSRPITSAALSTDVVIQVSTLDMEIADGENLSCVLPDNTSLEVEVESFTPTSVTVSQAIGTALPPGTEIMPIRFGWNRGSADLASFAIGAEDLGITFELTDYLDISALNLAYFTTHPVDGRPIVTAPLYFDGDARSGELVSNITTRDGKTGDLAQFRAEPIARPGQQVVVYCDSHADQHAWRQFLHFVRGSWGMFYIPTGTNDLPLSASLSLGGNTISIPASMQVGSLIGTQAPRRDVVVTEPGGVHYRRVNTIVPAGADETVTLSAAIPGSGSVPAEDVTVSWLTPSRIVGDTATFRHLRKTQAELRFRVRGVIE